MVTADTITDEQIRELRADSIAGCYSHVFKPETQAIVSLCERALDADGTEMLARARIAEIINAREASKAVR